MVIDSKGKFIVNAYFSPTSNLFRDENGLQYAIFVNDELPQIVSLNKDDKTSDKGTWNKGMSENIIKSTTHKIAKSGKHTANFWMATPASFCRNWYWILAAWSSAILAPKRQ